MITRKEKEDLLARLREYSNDCGENAWVLYDQMEQYISAMETAPQGRDVLVQWEGQGGISSSPVRVPMQMPIGSIKDYLEAMYSRKVRLFRTRDATGTHVYTPDGMVTFTECLRPEDPAVLMKLARGGTDVSSCAFTYLSGEGRIEMVTRTEEELQGKWLAEDIVWKAPDDRKKGLPGRAMVPDTVLPEDAGKYLEGKYGTPVSSYRKTYPEGFCVYTPKGPVKATVSKDEAHPGICVEHIVREGYYPRVRMEYTEDGREGPRIHAMAWPWYDAGGAPGYDIAMSPGTVSAKSPEIPRGRRIKNIIWDEEHDCADLPEEDDVPWEVENRDIKGYLEERHGCPVHSFIAYTKDGFFIHTPAGPIAISTSTEDEYPGIWLLYCGEGAGRPGALMSYSPEDGTVGLKVWTKDDPTGDPMEFPMSHKE